MCDVSYDDEPAEVWSNVEITARKQHQCSTCDGLIRPGQVYVKHFSVFDGRPSSEKVCPSCVALIEKYKELHDGASWVPSHMRHAVDDCIEQELDDPEEGSSKRIRMWRAELRKMDARAATAKRRAQAGAVAP